MRIAAGGDGLELNNNKPGNPPGHTTPAGNTTATTTTQSPTTSITSQSRHSSTTAPGYTPYEQMYGSKFRYNTALSHSDTRESPLPSLQWADSKEVC